MKNDLGACYVNTAKNGYQRLFARLSTQSKTFELNDEERALFRDAALVIEQWLKSV